MIHDGLESEVLGLWFLEMSALLVLVTKTPSHFRWFPQTLLFLFCFGFMIPSHLISARALKRSRPGYPIFDTYLLLYPGYTASEIDEMVFLLGLFGVEGG